MSNRNLAAWKFLIFLKEQKITVTTANIWNNIFSEIEEELTQRDKSLPNLDASEDVQISESDANSGENIILTLTMEAYNRYLLQADEKVTAWINEMKEVSADRKLNCEKTENEKPSILDLIKLINEEQSIHKIMKMELAVMITKIGNTKIKTKTHSMGVTN